MVTRWFAGDRAVFYLDESTLLDRSKNVRGGNPVLFPSPGKLAGDRFAHAGRSGAMKQHGFARNRAWTIVDRRADEVTLRIASNDETRAQFPWDFVATIRYALRGASLRVEQRIEAVNEEVPFAFGFHPYFAVPQATKAKARIPTTAKRAFDNVHKNEIALTGPIDLTGPEVDLFLIGHEGPSATLDFGDGHRVEIAASPEYRRWIVWTLAGKDFVCLEPWTSPGNALNTGDDLLVVRPGSPVELWVEMTFT
jgi:galactose mutarotase-like enzyme